MKPHTGNWKIAAVWTASVLMLCLQWGYGQEIPDTLATTQDSISLPQGIPYNEILIAAGESRIRTIRISKSLISPDRIQRENRRNDSIMVLIDSALSRTYAIDYSLESQRFLINERNYWETANDHIKTQKKRLSGLIRDLQDQQGQLESEIRRWENTGRMKDSSYALGNIPQVIDTTLVMLNGLATEIQERTELLIAPLNKTITTEVEVDLLLEKIRQALREKTTLDFSDNTPALFELDPGQSSGTQLRSIILASLRSEWNAVVFHYNQHKKTYFFFFAFVARDIDSFFLVEDTPEIPERGSPDLLSNYHESYPGAPVVGRNALQPVLHSCILPGPTAPSSGHDHIPAVDPAHGYRPEAKPQARTRLPLGFCGIAVVHVGIAPDPCRYHAPPLRHPGPGDF